MHKAYEVLGRDELKNLNATGTILRHVKSGARICLVENEDDNKVFYIGFRTPPFDSTGVPHIIEHSVLCGSQKYPIKDPFVELVKGSLNTFLNAMTYPDKTVYPVASCNDQDFKNLMDVYLDAVLHPNIYDNAETFMQEGWHYEMESPEGDLTINGVVYNEMKGAFSSPDSLVERARLNGLFPDTAYGVESGGDPKDIPNLTYEAFLDFHQRYYHPCNSYIYLYGDMDMAERLDYLDREYLSKYEDIHLDSTIAFQQPFDAPKDITIEYPISESEETEDNTYLTYSFVVGDSLDAELYQAFDILDYALCSSPAAPLREALIKKGIGKDVMGGYDSGLMQTTFGIEARNANPEDKQAFIDTIFEVLREQAENGIDKDTLLARINNNQFTTREADFGSYPKGLIFGIDILESWLYDDAKPFIHLHAIEVLDELKKKVGTRYFEELIEKYFLSNNHALMLMAVPKKGLGAEGEAKLAAELAAKKATLSAEEIDAIIEQTALLKEHQQQPITKEEMACLPMLKREDLRRKERPIDMEELLIDDTTTLYHPVFTSGINYLNLVFDIAELPLDDLPYVSLISRAMGLVNTASYTYGELCNQINTYTGGIAVSIGNYAKDNGDYRITVEVRSKFTYDNMAKANELIQEMILKSSFADEDRMLEILQMQKSRLEMRMNSAGDGIASSVATACFSKTAYISDITGGLSYYRFVKDLEANFEERKDDLIKRCQQIVTKIFRPEHLLVSTTGDETALNQVKQILPELKKKLFSGDDFVPAKHEFNLTKINRGLKDASQIQYVCCAGNYRSAGYEKNGAQLILKTILSYEYLWINVRVQGGAYGCRASFGANGNVFFSSYRDPNLEKTREVFLGTADYIEAFDANEDEMTKYIIGTISGIDVPLTPSQKGLRALSCYLREYTDEDNQKTRDQVLDATVEDIRALAPMLRATLSQGYFAVVGNEDAIAAASNLFDIIEPLF